MGLLYKIRIRVVNFLVFFFLVVLIPGLPPKTTFPFEGFSIPPLKELKGGLELNNHLDNAERLYEGKLYGPEAILVRDKQIFTSIHGGEVVAIVGQHITHVAKFGKPCESTAEEDVCGRPLGMAFDTQGNNLIVADAYYGIWLVDLSTKDKFQLVSRDTILEGKGVNRKPRLFNSVAVAKNGDIYWTESTSDFELMDGVFSLFSNPSGRLFHYDRKTKKNTVLLDRLYFANGLALSPNEDFVVVAETMSSLIHRYYLKGPKAGTDDIFVDGLPGMPDNLIANEEGLWAPLVMAADEENPSLTRLMSRVPLVRKFCSRMLMIAELPFRILHQVWPTVHSQRLLHAIGHFETMRFLVADRVTLVRLDWKGNIVGSLHGFDKSVSSVSHVAELGDYLLLGSPFNKFLARVPIPKVPKMSVQNVRFEPAGEGSKKPEVTTTTTTTTTPKPTTTTAAPTTTTTTTTTTPKPTTTTTTTKKPVDDYYGGEL
ncbi:adipocyte plasma membrane-associated protein Hemomucin isoform X2 [Armigeres subalbatus]|uniref:adipocyte plasma membrane-associated protein Hemomucin isoform X2 n=1 Tax=Armigeres subalbatus TaxID=124917 RepID=UPI002ED1B773